MSGVIVAAMPYLCVQGTDNWSVRAWCAAPAMARPCDRCIMHAARMVGVLRCCHQVALSKQTLDLLQLYCLNAVTADASTLRHVYFPYLKGLLQMLDEYGIPRKSSTYQGSFQEIVTDYIIRYVGFEPVAPTPNFPSSEHNLWLQRVEYMNELMHDIGPDSVWKELLGERYHEIMGLKAVRMI